MKKRRLILLCAAFAIVAGLLFFNCSQDTISNDGSNTDERTTTIIASTTTMPVTTTLGGGTTTTTIETTTTLVPVVTTTTILSNLNLTINLIIPNGNIVSFDTTDDLIELSKKSNMNATIKPVIADSFNWIWYIDGTKSDETSDSFFIDSSLYDYGLYKLTLTTQKDEESYSKSINFKIIY